MKLNYLSSTIAIAALYLSGSLYAQKSDTLKEKTIEEVVVIGYGKAKAKDLTGSVSLINLNKTGNQPVADIGQAIQGRASGVTVINSGEPGSNVTFRIRGTGTIQNNNPLIVVDGMPLNGGLNQINMSDVESINILKDASSTAIYGSRGANGVVMITTKRGAKGGILNFDTFTGVQSVSNMIKVLDASQYAQLNNEMLANGGLTPNPEFANPSSLGAGTNWLGALFNPSILSSYSLSYGDRSEKSNLYVSTSYFNQKGVVLNTNYDRYIVQINGDTKLKSFLKVGNSVKLQHDIKKNGSYDIKGTILSLPTRPIYDANGNWAGPGSNPLLYGDIDNPIGKATIVENSTKGYNIQGNIYAEAEIIKDLKFKSLGGIETNIWYNRTWSPKYSWGVKSQENSYLFEGSNRSITLLWDNTLTYDKTIGKHHINAVVGSSAQNNKYNYLSASVQKFASDNTQQIDNGILQPVQHGNASEWAIMSYLGRVNYNFANKYYVTATIRRDGSSRFGMDNRWGWFPSAALAWRISNENFLKNSNVINNLKLRLGYGITGNQEIGNYSFSSSYNTYLYNFNNSYVSAVLPTVLPNPNVKWEGQEQYNAGFDLDLFNNRISLIVDGYVKNTNDMLVPMSVPVTSGYSDVYVPSINAGKIQNKGFEVTLSTKNIIKNDFKWSSDAVFSYNKNNVVNINSDTPIITASGGFNSAIGLIKEGYPVNVFYGYITDGIFQNQDEVDRHAVQMPGSNSATSTAPGDIRFKDLNNDGVINDKDRTVIGNPNPKFTFSLNNTFNYKNFDLTIFLQGSYGNDIFNANRMYTEAMSIIQNQSTAVLGRWTGEGTSNNIPRAIYGDPNQNSRVSDRYIEDGSYLKIKNINLSYTLPKAVFGQNFNSVKIFVSAQNLVTWTKYSGFDPEVPVNGIDNGTYPITRTVSLGLNIGF
ncbi:SusC/RagA family TonB-linked outer membrane protein [Cloacibacterium normanense]|uniref:TonB-linked outer membrane, SusC/RagA family protein n=1 Tax=Cloacibacterium normanense TaxID=237258 RepID=A0A1E5UHZ1_9FLAO|nr:TonB-dependent receptor [Cloacibacterium normanense]AZI68980.1 TonB-dependent receptor [Cloacibacterium normanense]OEL12486.1 tonB-linked outer membrane, SusC/RagA family protein [Cloacibacterium normanense]SDO59571.1 TonB-linked outer membrane protein, SusC/RagA family [Cloacibacterium normanense]